jgi:PEP-CTERM motif
MNTRVLIATLLSSSALTAVLGTVNVANAAACNTPFVKGDVFASVGPQSVSVFTPSGSLVCTMSDGIGGITTGSGFDAAGNLYVTTFGSGGVAKFNNSGVLQNSAFFSGLSNPESVTNVSNGPFAGSSFVSTEGSASLKQFNTATGALTHTFTVTGGNGTGGTDWMDFLNPTTAIYDGEGTKILRYNLATSTQLTDFTSAATESALTHIFALRTIPAGAFAGDVLVANSINAVLLDASGNIIKTYTLPGDAGLDFALNLDPNGTDFWTGDITSDNVWEVNIATGAIDQQWNAGGRDLYGLSVFGELTTSGPPPSVPEPGTLALFGAGLAGLGMVRRRRRRT